ncbi:MAG: glycoside hydrolase family 3 N-terminal domain-containing protein [Planctomycetota bacterium]|nr:glycoside hydrolase family 3 N-terminal domain-containing protein [Planctomycetota bacterium]
MLDLPLLVPAIRLDRDDGTQEEVALRRAKEPWLAGFILFGGEVEQVATLTKRLREEAGRHLIIASDMERGAGQQVRGLTRLPDAGIVGLAATPPEAWKLGELTATEARSVGIDVVFAPVADVRSTLDNPILGNRSFGFDAARVAELARHHANGIAAGGALAVGKHFPGHGATTLDSHDAVPVVEDAAHVLEQRDLMPFCVLDCAGLMTAHVAYPALDPSGAIATFSKPILDLSCGPQDANPETQRALFTDALNMAGAHIEGGEPEAARRALAAGCDFLLYPDHPEAIAAVLDAGSEDVARAAARASRFIASAATATACPEDGDDMPDGAVVARSVARRALDMVSFWPWPDGIGLLVIDDDDIEDRGALLRRRAAEQGVPFELIRLPRGETPVLEPLTDDSRGRPTRAIVVFASARAWKGCAGVSPACRELVAATRRRLTERDELVDVLWCTPRYEDPRDAHVPGSGPHLEEAIADRIFGSADS